LALRQREVWWLFPASRAVFFGTGYRCALSNLPFLPVKLGSRRFTVNRRNALKDRRVIGPARSREGTGAEKHNPFKVSPAKLPSVPRWRRHNFPSSEPSII